METSGQVTYNQAEINVKKIEEEIAKLKGNLSDTSGRKNYREFWEQSHYVINLFKLLKPILPEDKDRVWKEFAELREQTKQQEIADREVRRNDSAEKRKFIEQQIADIETQLVSAQDYSDLEKVKELLQSSLNILKGTASSQTSAAAEEEIENQPENQENAAGSVSEDVLIREDKEACWVLWRKTNEAVKQKRTELEEKVFNTVKAEIMEVVKAAGEGNPHEALKRIKEIQSDPKTYKFSKTFREEIKALLNTAFDSSIKRIKDIRDENKRRHQEWLTRMEANVERWKELREKNTNIIAGLEAQIVKLEEDVVNAKTPEFAERIRTWIDEKAAKIKDIKETNAKLDEKIDSVMKSVGKNAE